MAQLAVAPFYSVFVGHNTWVTSKLPPVEKLRAEVLVASKGRDLLGWDVQGDGALRAFCRGVEHSVWEAALGQGGGKGAGAG